MIVRSECGFSLAPGWHNPASTASGGIASVPAHAHGLAGDRRQPPAEIAPVEMLDFQKSGVFPGRLIGPEMPHDAKGRSAFEGAAKGRARDREIGLGCPARELRRIEKKASGMRVVDA